MIETLFFDDPFGRANDTTFRLALVSPNVQQVTTKNQLVDSLLYFLRKPQKWRAG